MMESITSKYLSVCEGNASESNTTSDLWLVEDKTNGQVTAAFFLLFLVIGLPWNLLVIVTIVKQRLYTQPTIILLLNLVVTDLILVSTEVPFLLLTGLKGEFFFGATDNDRCRACKIGIISQIFVLNSVLNLSLMSFDRFLFVYKPFKYSYYVTSCRTIVVITLVWIVILLLALKPLFGTADIVFLPAFLGCFLNLSGSYAILVSVVVVLPMVALIVFNVWLCCIVRKNIRAVYQVRQPQPGHRTAAEEDLYRSMKKKRQQKELHLIKVFGWLVCSYVVTWLPNIIVGFLLFLDVAMPTAVTSCVHVCFVLQVVLHPILQTALIKDVRLPVKRLWCCCCVLARARLTTNGHTTSEHICGCLDPQSLNWCGSGCGFFEVCNAAMASHDGGETTKTTVTDPA